MWKSLRQDVAPTFRRHRSTGTGSPPAPVFSFLPRAAAAAEVEAEAFFYPGWTATVDGVPAPASASPIRGTIVFPIPPGEHRVVLALKPTRTRRLALLLTAATLGLGLLALGIARLAPSSRAAAPGKAKAPPGDGDAR